MPAQQFYPVKLISKQTIARDILELRFERPGGFIFLGGQFVQFQIPEGEKFVLRSYSISSSPEKEYLEFCVKILSNGKASVFFDKMELSETVMMSLAKGHFVCKEGDSPHKIFIATGTGLAPVISMIERISSIFFQLILY